MDAVPRPIAWDVVVALAGRHGFLQSLLPGLEERGLLDLAPSDAIEAFRELHAQTLARRGEAAGQIERISLALNEAGIEPLWFKGAALVVTDSRWAARRWMSDLDLWIEPKGLREAEGALRRHGYDFDPRYDSPARHQLRPLFHPRERLGVEIHYLLAPPLAAPLVAPERVLDRARRIDWHGARILVPDLADQAILVAVQARPHAGSYLHGRLPVRRVCEFVQIAADLGADRAAEELRLASREADQGDFASEFLALASALFDFPGEYEAQGAVEGFAFKACFPRVHSLYFGYKGLAGRGFAYHVTHPREFARTFVRHVRRSMNPHWQP